MIICDVKVSRNHLDNVIICVVVKYFYTPSLNILSLYDSWLEHLTKGKNVSKWGWRIHLFNNLNLNDDCMVGN